MSLSESTLDLDALRRASALLKEPQRRDPTWPALLAATALAITSVAFATIMVLAPPVTREHVAHGAPE